MFGLHGMTDNDGLKQLMLDAETGYGGRPRNRAVHMAKVVDVLAPDGQHICDCKMLHNDCEWRTRWKVAVLPGTQGAEDLTPDLAWIEIWLDVDMDVLKQHLQPIRHRPGGQE
jgi:hypothetical protein